jgi:hypothetical protein
MAILATFSMLSGCTTMGRDLVRDNTVKIEKISSSHGTVSLLRVMRKGEEVTLCGEVRHRSNLGHGPIPGHIDIEVLDPSGEALERKSAASHMYSVRSRFAKCCVVLDNIPPSRSTVRVEHHYDNRH